MVVSYGTKFDAADSSNKVLFEVTTKDNAATAWKRAKLPINENQPFRVCFYILLGNFQAFAYFYILALLDYSL